MRAVALAMPEPFVLEVHNWAICVPHHPLWVMASLLIASIVSTCIIHRVEIGQKDANEVYLDENAKANLPDDPSVVHWRIFPTLSETWKTPSAKIVMIILLAFVCVHSSVCFLHPHIVGFVYISCVATLVVVLTYWARDQHQVSSLLLAGVNSMLQILINLKVLRVQTDVEWIVLLTLQCLFVALFVGVVSVALHAKQERAAGMDVRGWVRCNAVTLPYIETANLLLFFITLLFVRDPQYT